MTSFVESWVNKSDDLKKLYFQEKLILETTEMVLDHMDKNGISKTELAERMGKGKSHITQLLNGSRNMTLRSLSDISCAIGFTPHVQLRDSLIENDWQVDAGVIPFRASRNFKFHYSNPGQGLDYGANDDVELDCCDGAVG